MERLIIAPNYMKNILLQEKEKNNELVYLKIITREEYLKNILFDYDSNAVLYIMDKYKYNSSVAKILLNNMIYVDKKKTSNKINRLIDLKQELIDKKILIFNPLYKEYLKNKQVIVTNYKIDKLLERMLPENYVLEEARQETYINNKVYEANSITEEISFVFNKIGDLLTKGIDINNIKIVNYSDKYDNVIKKLSKLYNVPVSDTGYSIYSTEIVKEYLNKLKESESIKESFDYVKNKYNSSKLISKILSISNKYNSYIDDYTFNSIYTLIEEDLKKSKLSINLKNKVELLPFSNVKFDDDKYIFLIGFNQGELPRLYKDEDYFTDKEKELLNIETTKDNNKIEREKVIDFINSTKNLVMSYPLKHLSNNYYPSILIEENHLEVEPINQTNISYSSILDKLRLGSYLDDLIKYGTKNNELSILYNNYKIDYLTYKNMYTGIKKEDLLKKLDNKLLLSYSSINNYNKCNFRYYLDNILKINKYEESFQIKIGNLFHYLLSICFNDDFDLDKEWDKYVNGLELNSKEKVFIKKLKEEFIFIIESVRALHKETGLTKIMLEKKIYVNKSINNIDVNFMGIIDKLMYKDDLVSIIDYKTGNPDLNLGNIAYGIDMQLPIYWYLVKHSSLFDNPKFVGFYLQKILNTEVRRDEKKTLSQMKKDNLKLVGYSSEEQDRVEVFDPSYEDSIFIRSMKLKKDGTYSGYTKTLCDEELDKLVDYIDKIIDSDRDSILNAKFDINPKQIGQENIGCKFCKYRDICYMKNDDIENLKEYKDLSFLGGDNNA